MKKLFWAWKRAGFTLMELLVVIAIIALLLAILLPALKRAHEQAKRAVCAENMKSLCTAIVAFAGDNDEWAPPLNLDNGRFNNLQEQNHHSRFWHVQETATNPKRWTNYFNLGFLWRDGYIKQGEAFYCPSSRYFRFKDYDYNPNGRPPNQPFPQDVQPSSNATWAVRIPYIYNPICISETNRERKCKKITDFKGSNSLMIVDVLEGGVAHINGWNVARGDGSINFVVDKTIVDDMQSSDCEDLLGQKYDCWDKIMGKFLEQ